ncbi:RecB family exonuclease [Patescibacteria group bacterium]
METKTKDKYKALWLSHSSIGDFLKCPRLYYLRAIYKDPKTGNKMTIMTPPLALGQIVHEIVESLSILPTKDRFRVSPLDKFNLAWEKITGEKGGFFDSAQEAEYKDRGVNMLKRLEQNPGPLLNKTIKIKTEDGLPYYWFSEEENMILCGKIDWLEYLDLSDSVHIIDFKTGKNEEDEDSLQLPIYLLLASNTQSKKVEKLSFWYLDNREGIKEQDLPDMDASIERVEKIAKRIKLARQINRFNCQHNGCMHCNPYERVLKSEGKKVGISEYRQDIYILNK